MKKTIAVMLCALLSSGSVLAAGACYSPAEVKAEHLLRLHSELMVITVTCHQSSKGDDLVPYYTGFTKANITILHNTEQTMQHYYKARYGGSGIDRLDKLRTKLGNEFGQQIADSSAPVFCAQHRDMVLEMYSASPESLDAEVRYLIENQKPYEKACAAAKPQVAKKTK